MDARPDRDQEHGILLHGRFLDLHHGDVESLASDRSRRGLDACLCASRALLLTATALWFSPNLTSFRWDADAIVDSALRFQSGESIQSSAYQLIFGFFAMLGLLSADWGAASCRGRDVVLGGVTGVFFASFWTALMALVVIAGSLVSIGAVTIRAGDPLPLSYRWAIFHGVGGYGAATILILFGLAALANVCYSVAAFGNRLSTHWPRLRMSYWTWFGGALAFVLMVTYAVDSLGWIFGAMGAVFAPAIGAIVADRRRQRGRWVGIRQGVNMPGIAAWAIGCTTIVGLEIFRTFIPGSALALQPTALFGCWISGVVYMFLADRGLELEVTPILAPEATP